MSEWSCDGWLPPPVHFLQEGEVSERKDALTADTEYGSQHYSTPMPMARILGDGDRRQYEARRSTWRLSSAAAAAPMLPNSAYVPQPPTCPFQHNALIPIEGQLTQLYAQISGMEQLMAAERAADCERLAQQQRESCQQLQQEQLTRVKSLQEHMKSSLDTLEEKQAASAAELAKQIHDAETLAADHSTAVQQQLQQHETRVRDQCDQVASTLERQAAELAQLQQANEQLQPLQERVHTLQQQVDKLGAHNQQLTQQLEGMQKQRHADTLQHQQQMSDLQQQVQDLAGKQQRDHASVTDAAASTQRELDGLLGLPVKVYTLEGQVPVIQRRLTEVEQRGTEVKAMAHQQPDQIQQPSTMNAAHTHLAAPHLSPLPAHSQHALPPDLPGVSPPIQLGVAEAAAEPVGEVIIELPSDDDPSVPEEEAAAVVSVDDAAASSTAADAAQSQAELMQLAHQSDDDEDEEVTRAMHAPAPPAAQPSHIGGQPPSSPPMLSSQHKQLSPPPPDREPRSIRKKRSTPMEHQHSQLANTHMTRTRSLLEGAGVGAELESVEDPSPMRPASRQSNKRKGQPESNGHRQSEGGRSRSRSRSRAKRTKQQDEGLTPSAPKSVTPAASIFSQLAPRESEPAQAGTLEDYTSSEVQEIHASQIRSRRAPLHDTPPRMPTVPSRPSLNDGRESKESEAAAPGTDTDQATDSSSSAPPSYPESQFLSSRRRALHSSQAAAYASQTGDEFDIDMLDTHYTREPEPPRPATSRKRATPKPQALPHRPAKQRTNQRQTSTPVPPALSGPSPAPCAPFRPVPMAPGPQSQPARFLTQTPLKRSLFEPIAEEEDEDELPNSVLQQQAQLRTQEEQRLRAEAEERRLAAAAAAAAATASRRHRVRTGKPRATTPSRPRTPSSTQATGQPPSGAAAHPSGPSRRIGTPTATPAPPPAATVRGRPATPVTPRPALSGNKRVQADRGDDMYAGED